MTHQTTAEIREQLRGMALSLATGSGPLVEPSAFDAALDAYRTAVLREAADAIEAEQHRLDDEENERLGGLSESAAAEHVAIHRAAGTLRHMADDPAPAAVSAAVAPPTQAVLRDFLWRLEQSAGDAAAEKFLDDNPELRRMADETATETPTAVDLPTLAAALDGLHTLIATSSRDWQTYRVDAWLWAVLCGWDCEQTEHDDTCVHGALEETAARHGWDEATVAKARRYRAAVRAVTEHQPAAGARQDGAET